ncbi:hypothetical protein [Micromonospora aurantiaca]|uniref:DUF4355 domain-containing protein n=1 Tax=Micromonospora aurantiaca (nom. illeg.) TaxID=47850 RepID=A0A6N3JUH4_9ACTN|nr:hypothetical protein [Micromonospora aurantiaca]AXH89415.1 hypothetical protein DVH21_05385 [Micromonospora aurantiaca]
MKIHLPAIGPDLPIHPRTGLTALGLRRNGQPIWPVRGASPDDPGEGDQDGGDDGPDVPPGTGDAGKQAIDRMKQERNEERKARRALEAKLAEYQKAEQEKAEADKTEAEKRAAAEQRAEQAELRALRLEVAAEKGLTPAQAKRLVGATREELEADADDILATFPTAPAVPAPKPTPKPDPSQGSRGGGGKPSAQDRAAKRLERLGIKNT